MEHVIAPFLTAPAVPEPVWIDDLPILYEDEDEGEMGESNPHVGTDEILHVCIVAHLRGGPLQAYANMNLYYLSGPPHPRTGSKPYVSPDLMVVEPFHPLPETVASYTIGEDGPAPRLVAEILSQRSAQQRDLKEKLVVYARLGVPEYLIVDPIGKFMKPRLVLKVLQEDGLYRDEVDAGAGLASSLGFRIFFDVDGRIRLRDEATGMPYVRPHEAQDEALARRLAEEARRQAEADNERLRAEIERLKKGKRRKKPGSDRA